MHLPGVLREQAEAVEARLAVLADSLTQRVETADKEVRQRVAGERRLSVEVPLAVGGEVVNDIADSVAVLAAKSELMTALWSNARCRRTDTRRGGTGSCRRCSAC